MSRPFTAEIIGPAGSGKSTLTGLLRERDAGIKTGISIWGLPPFLLATSTLYAIPDILATLRHSLSFEDIKLVIQINALRRLLRQESEKGYRALLMDEGGVFGLAKLSAFGVGGESLKANELLNDLSNRIGPTLDAVIWLDAPDAVLARRIREREKPHRTKTGTDAEISEHLASYRKAFEGIVGELAQRNSVKVIRFRTDREQLEDIADQILAVSPR